MNTERHCWPSGASAVALAVALSVSWFPSVALAEEFPALPADFGSCPSELVPFLRNMVQRRAAEGLNRIVLTEKDPRFAKRQGHRAVQIGTVYGGTAEDANIAWIAAAAYKYAWSRFHKNPLLCKRAFFLMDALTRIHTDGRWDDGGLAAYFGLQSFAWAALSWIETGDVDDARAAAWRQAVVAAANDAMWVEHHNIYAGNYANPEFYYLSGLAAAWKLTGEEKYLKEAATALRRYEDSLFPGGGVAYFLKSSPEHGYQQMVVKSVVLYWDLTQDPYALSWLRRLAPYFPNVQHRSGLLTDAEVPHLKHSLYKPLNPAAPAMLAAALDDGANRYAADVAAKVRADNANNRLPSFFEKNPNWYNYHHTTYVAAALRVIERHPLPAPKPLPARQVFLDGSYRGVRSHWDDFTAAVGTRRMNDSLAGAYLADPSEPMLPLNAAVNGVRFEILEGDRGPKARRDQQVRAIYRCVDWSPSVDQTATDGFAAVSCLTALCSPYWGDMPWIPGERWHLREVSNWTSLQHWAVWRDHLVGLGALCCHADGGSATTHDAARILFPLVPDGRKLIDLAHTDTNRHLRYGSLVLRIEQLAEKGGFAFGTDGDGHSPIVLRPAPWKTGDYVNVATDIHPAGSDGKVLFKPLQEAAAALMVEPGGQKCYLWIASLVRHWRQHELPLPAGVTVTLFKGQAEMPPVPADRVAVCSLHGGQSAVWLIESSTPVNAKELLKALRSGWGRGEPRPQSH